MSKNYVEKYIEFKDGGVSPTGKTRVWQVISTKDRNIIGVLKWYGGFRKYCFFPDVNVDWVTFDAACLRLVADKLDEVNARKHEASRRKKMQTTS